MLLKRRDFLLAGGALGAASLLPKAFAAKGARVVVVGGGWAGLSAARHLRALAPELEVTLLERNPGFWSCPLSNKWLVGQVGDDLLTHDYAAAARASGYRFVQAEASAIDRDARRVVTSQGNVPYDWLVLATGIRQDWRAWFGADDEAAAQARKRFPSAWTPGAEFAVLRKKLDAFRGGDLLMSIPPPPYRCPPAPYERAALLAGWFAARGIPARIVILDANPPFREFQRIFEEFGPRILYRAQTPVVGIDLQRRIARTDFEEFGFDDAILMPPQQAGALAWQAGLIGRDAAGQPTGWVAADPLSFATHADTRIYAIGDTLDRVSELFGHYPKTAHIAVQQGRLVARQIVARLRDSEISPELPQSLCHIATRYAPPEAIRIAAHHRLRGDGTLVQQVRTERDPQPRGEDVAWLRGLLDELFRP